LFTGDIGKEQEEQLLITSSLPVGLGADVLKIPHHGSKTSSSERFMEIVNPQVAVISCGKDNSYGHPALETLRVLEQFAIKIKRTDQEGDIKIISNGINLSY